MKQLLLLQRYLNGRNEVVEVTESARTSPSVKNFAEFIKEIGLFSEKGILELAQVLKVPYSQLRNCDLIDEHAQENILYYWRECRIPSYCIEFLSAQNGEAGESNSPPRDEDPENHKDNCG